MNPTAVTAEAYHAGYNRARRELASKKQKSRAAQPRRKDNRKTTARRAR